MVQSKQKQKAQKVQVRLKHLQKYDIKHKIWTKYLIALHEEIVILNSTLKITESKNQSKEPKFFDHSHLWFSRNYSYKRYVSWHRSTWENASWKGKMMMFVEKI